MKQATGKHSVVDFFLGRRGASYWLWLSLVTIVADQVSKWYILQNFDYARPSMVNSWLDITYLRNYGAAFSFLSDASGWQRWFFIALGIAVSVLILIWLARLPGRGQQTLASALALILGGALGNVIDRANHGFVVDFIHVHYQDWYWPAFNVADSAITAGAVLLILDAIFCRDEPGVQSG